MNIVTQIITLVILIFLSGIFSGTEMAFFSLSKVQVQGLVNKKKRFAHLVARLKARPQRLLITILFGNNLVNVAASILAAVLVEEVFGSRAIGFVTGVMTFLILVFGEIVPKSFAEAHAEKYARTIAPFMKILIWLIFPVVWALEKITKFATRKSSRRSTLVFEEELKAMLQMGLKERQIEKYESDLIQRTLVFDDLIVHKVITSWKEVIVLDGDVLIDQIAHFVARTPYSRFPVFLKRKNNIIGYVHVKGILAKLKSAKRDQKLATIAKTIESVSFNMPISDLFNKMKERRYRMALVKNQKGKIIGIVTLRNLTEKIIGDYPLSTDIPRLR